MPRELPDELLEEVLRRLPPQEPAELVHAALVSRRWCRLVSDPGFRRRFREFHRSPLMLGMLGNFDDEDDVPTARFIPTTAFSTPRTDRQHWRVLDARHGRVLLGGKDGALVVWDPITGEEQELPLPPRQLTFSNAAVLCSAAAGACDHLDCHHRPYLVVFVCSECVETLVYSYSSDAAVWSDPIWDHTQGYCVESYMASALVGNALYFGNLLGKTALKYNLELCQMSLIKLPYLTWHYVFTTLEDGGLGIATEDDSNLYIWSRKDAHEVDAIWERRVVIELKTIFPADVALTRVSVIGSVDGVGIIFIRVSNAVYTLDLKTYKVKKVYKGTAYSVFPYMSFYTPALGGTTGEEPSASSSSA